MGIEDLLPKSINLDVLGYSDAYIVHDIDEGGLFKKRIEVDYRPSLLDKLPSSPSFFEGFCKYSGTKFNPENLRNEKLNPNIFVYKNTEPNFQLAIDLGEKYFSFEFDENLVGDYVKDFINFVEKN